MRHPEVLIPFRSIRIERSQHRTVLLRNELLEHPAFRAAVAARQSLKRKINLRAYPHVQPAISVALVAWPLGATPDTPPGAVLPSLPPFIASVTQ